MKPRITFKLAPVEPWGVRGWHARYQGRRVGEVSFSRAGWGWSVPPNPGLGIAWRNSWSEGVRYSYPGNAKQDCAEYLVACLEAASK